MKKRLRAIVAMLGVSLFVLTGKGDVKAADVEKVITNTEVTNIEQIDTTSSYWSYIYDMTGDSVNKDTAFAETRWAEFTLPEESYVLVNLKRSRVLRGYGYYAATLNICYTNERPTAFEIAVESYSSTDSVTSSTILPAGTYYIRVAGDVSANIMKNYTSELKGEIGVSVATIPTRKLVSLNKTVNNGVCTVTFSSAFGSYSRPSRYRLDKVSYELKDRKTYWGEWYSWKSAFSDVDGVYNATDNGNGTYSFTTNKNGDYTICIEDIYGTRYTTTDKVTNLVVDKTKPKVTGVKNGKTYKKAVTIKFSDKGSGIKKATLNGKKIKSGKKVKKKGKYTLKVTDKAGNNTTVKFKIK
jgi:hypothetical protein